MGENYFYYDECSFYNEPTDSTNRKTNSYSLIFFDKNDEYLDEIYLDEEIFFEEGIKKYNIPSQTSFFSLILSYEETDGSVRAQTICNYCLKDEVKIVHSQLLSLNNDVELYGDFRLFDNLDGLNKISNFIINSFYEKKLPLSGEYTSVIKQIEFVKTVI